MIDPLLCACGRKHPCGCTRLACLNKLPPYTDSSSGKQYVDSWTTPHGMLVSSPSCEHCDGEHSRYVRNDHLRGWVCPSCDSALDEMLKEGPFAP